MASGTSLIFGGPGCCITGISDSQRNDLLLQQELGWMMMDAHGGGLLSIGREWEGG